MDKLIDISNQQLRLLKEFPNFDIKKISDGYHTFEELYEFRMLYNAILFNQWAEIDNISSEEGILEKFAGYSDNFPKYNVHKSWKHNDGEWCFGEEKKWFIVSAMLPTGLISNHYKAKYWDLFKIPEVDKVLFKFDGHTSQDVVKRLSDLIKNS